MRASIIFIVICFFVPIKGFSDGYDEFESESSIKPGLFQIKIGGKFLNPHEIHKFLTHFWDSERIPSAYDDYEEYEESEPFNQSGVLHIKIGEKNLNSIEIWNFLNHFGPTDPVKEQLSIVIESNPKKSDPFTQTENSFGEELAQTEFKDQSMKSNESTPESIHRLSEKIIEIYCPYETEDWILIYLTAAILVIYLILAFRRWRLYTNINRLINTIIDENANERA